MTHTISGTYVFLISLDSLAYNPTTITSTAKVTNGINITADLTVVNAGNADANKFHGYRYGMFFHAGGYVTNQSSGTIEGITGVEAAVAMTVVNAGYIAGGNGSGINFPAGGSVTNQVGGKVGGEETGIADYNGALTVVNSGLIQTQLGPGVFVRKGAASITNESGGIISSQGDPGAIYAEVPITVVNAGTITNDDFDFGIVLHAGGSVTNLSGGSIIGYAIKDIGGPLTVVNAGSIAGIAAGMGGVVTNQSGGTLTSGSRYLAAIYAYNAPLTVVNAGTIIGNAAEEFGIDLCAGGNVTNQGGGLIYSGYAAINDVGGAATVVNAGSIVSFSRPDFISNPNAIEFAAGFANRLIIDPGAFFYGVVDGGNTIGATAVSTLELAGTTPSTLLGIGTQFVNFVQTTIDAGASWTLPGMSGTGTFAAGTTLSNAGSMIVRDFTLSGAGLVVNTGMLTIDDTTLSDNGQVINSGSILIDSSTVTLADLTGTGVVTIDTGSTLDILGIVTSGETIVFATGDNVLGFDPTAFSGQIDGFDVGDAIQLAGVTDGVSAEIVNGNTLHIDRSGDPPVNLALDPSVDYTGDRYAVSSDGVVSKTPCFLTGTLIRTENGDIAVQDLSVGDRVVTLSGRSRPITWIGTGRVPVTPARRSAATPIIVCKGALADNVPHQDLHITQGHALFLDSVLIPVEFLVNHRTILWNDHQRTVSFYHIELGTHDVLLANGAPAESYRDDGNRWLFQNANTGWGQPPRPPCAPVLTGGPIVDKIWAQLLKRSGMRRGVPLTDDPDLHLCVDGHRLDAHSRIGGFHVFSLSGPSASVRIVSRASVPQELGLARDPRSLGVALRQIIVRQGAASRLICAADTLLADGFHAFEADNGFRWTDGDALLPHLAFAGFTGAIEVVLECGGATRYVEDGLQLNVA